MFRGQRPLRLSQSPVLLCSLLCSRKTAALGTKCGTLADSSKPLLKASLGQKLSGLTQKHNLPTFLLVGREAGPWVAAPVVQRVADPGKNRPQTLQSSRTTSILFSYHACTFRGSASLFVADRLNRFPTRGTSDTASHETKPSIGVSGVPAQPAHHLARPYGGREAFLHGRRGRCRVHVQDSGANSRQESCLESIIRSHRQCLRIGT